MVLPHVFFLGRILLKGVFHGAGGMVVHARYDAVVVIESYGYVRCLPGTRALDAI